MILPHAGGHRNYNVATLGTEKMCCALFFLPCFAGTVPKEATYVVTGDIAKWGSLIDKCSFRFFWSLH
jgi:hypothetical protein